MSEIVRPARAKPRKSRAMSLNEVRGFLEAIDARRAEFIQGAGTQGVVTQALFRGDAYTLSIALGAPRGPVILQAISEQRHAVGDRIGIEIDPQKLRWFAGDDA